MMVAKISIKFIAILVLFMTSVSAFAHEGEHDAQHHEEGNKVDTPEEIKEYIAHHLKDSHDFHLFTDNGTGVSYGFPLPVIVWSSKGLVTFMSSAFHHDDAGKVIVAKNGTSFVKAHSKIYELNDGATSVSFDEEHHATNASKVLDFSITKSVFGILLIVTTVVKNTLHERKTFATKSPSPINTTTSINV